MDIKIKNEKLEYIISRYDHYYESVNNKGNIYLTVNTFILGGIIGGYFSLQHIYKMGFPMLLLFILAIFFNFASITSTLIALKPYLNKKKDNEDGSAIFFGDVADYHNNNYQKIWENMTDEGWNNDLKKQVTLLACGLKAKYSYLSWATLFIAGQVLAVFIFGLNLLTIIKAIAI